MIAPVLADILVKSLCLTVVIECGLAFLLGYRKKDLLNTLLVNTLTNPPLVLVVQLTRIFEGQRAGNILTAVLEITVVLLEGFIYYKTLSRRKINPFVLSLILNASSYLLGLFINQFIY